MTGSWAGHSADKQMNLLDDGCMTGCMSKHVFLGFPWLPLFSTFVEVFVVDHSLWDVLQKKTKQTFP